MTHPNSIQTSIALVGALALSVMAGLARAQDYSIRPMRVLIGFPAGSGADILGRYFTTKLADLSGQSVIVENKPGANANIALSLVANAKPDGYTIGQITITAFRVPYMQKATFDPVKDSPTLSISVATPWGPRSRPTARSRNGRM